MVQQALHMLRAGKRESGAAQQRGEVLGLEGLVSRHHQQVKVSLLPVAQKQVLADAGPQGPLDEQAVLHGVGMVVIHPGEGDAQLFQFVVDSQLLGDTVIGGASLVDGGVDVHSGPSFSSMVLLHHTTAGTKSTVRRHRRDWMAVAASLVHGAPHLRWGPQELDDRKSKAARLGGFAAKFENLLQVEERLHAGVLRDAAQLPMCARHTLGTLGSICSAEVNPACAKVFAFGENACTALTRAPSAMGPPGAGRQEEQSRPIGRLCSKI